VLLQTGWAFVKKISVPTAGCQLIFHRMNLFYMSPQRQNFKLTITSLLIILEGLFLTKFKPDEYINTWLKNKRPT